MSARAGMALGTRRGPGQPHGDCPWFPPRVGRVIKEDDLDSGEAEVDGYVAGLAGEVGEHGHRLVVRNGHAEPRSIVTGAARSWSKRRGSTTGGSTR